MPNEFEALNRVTSGVRRQTSKLNSWLKSSSWEKPGEGNNPFSQAKTLPKLNDMYRQLASTVNENSKSFITYKYYEQRQLILSQYVVMLSDVNESINRAVESESYNNVNKYYNDFDSILNVMGLGEKYNASEYPNRMSLSYRMKKLYEKILKENTVKLEEMKQRYEDVKSYNEKIAKEEQSKANQAEAIEKFNKITNKGVDSPQLMGTLKIKK